VIMVIVMLSRVGPMVDPELVFALERRRVMRDGVQESGVPVGFRFTIGDDDRVDPTLLQVQRRSCACSSLPVCRRERFFENSINDIGLVCLEPVSKLASAGETTRKRAKKRSVHGST
jgi:hypothetical protein